MTEPRGAAAPMPKLLILFSAINLVIGSSAFVLASIVEPIAKDLGIGVAACLMASLRTFGLWLAPVQLPAVNGYMLAVGNAGAIASTAPVSPLNSRN